MTQHQHSIFDSRDYSESRPMPWRPALGEGSGAVNHARLMDALSGRRHALTRKEAGAIHRSKQQEGYRAERMKSGARYLGKPGASTDMRLYMQAKRAENPLYGRGPRGGGIGHRGPNRRVYDPATVAAAAVKRRATWNRKLGTEARTGHKATGKPRGRRRVRWAPNGHGAPEGR